MSDFCTCTPVYCTDMVAHHETCPQGRIEELEAENTRLREALEEIDALDHTKAAINMAAYKARMIARKALEEQR